MQRSLYSAITHFHLKQPRDRHSPLPLPRTGSLSLSLPSRRNHSVRITDRDREDFLFFSPPKLERSNLKVREARVASRELRRSRGGGRGRGRERRRGRARRTRKQVTRLSPKRAKRRVVYLSPFLAGPNDAACAMRNILGNSELGLDTPRTRASWLIFRLILIDANAATPPAALPTALVVSLVVTRPHSPTRVSMYSYVALLGETWRKTRHTRVNARRKSLVDWRERFPAGSEERLPEESGMLLGAKLRWWSLAWSSRRARAR